jgi:TrmH family RNA methyltransferase
MKEPDLSGFIVVLCRAQEAGNVGSTCRAMKTMGLGRLVLAGCPEYEEDRVRAMAVHAFDLYERALRFPDLASALSGSSLCAGFTRRRGERRKSFSISAADFAARVFSRPSHDEVALVFGNERTGLTDPELNLCSLAVHIPASEAFPSLNLSQAVQIACYELRKNALGGRDGSASPAGRAIVDASVARMSAELRSLGFFKVAGGRRIEDFLRDTAERAAYTPGELDYLEAIFRKAAGLARRNDPAMRGD